MEKYVDLTDGVTMIESDMPPLSEIIEPYDENYNRALVNLGEYMLKLHHYVSILGIPYKCTFTDDKVAVD